MVLFIVGEGEVSFYVLFFDSEIVVFLKVKVGGRRRVDERELFMRGVFIIR